MVDGASQVVQQSRAHLPMQEMCVQSLGREGPLEEGTAAHSSVRAWRIPRSEEPGRAAVHRGAESDTTE